VKNNFFLIKSFKKIEIKKKNLLFFDEYLFNLYDKKKIRSNKFYFNNNLKKIENFYLNYDGLIKKKLLSYRNQLSFQFNLIHKTNNNQEYWGILIDTFLYNLVTEIYRNFFFLKNIKKKYKNILNLNFNSNNYVKDTQNFIEYIHRYPEAHEYIKGVTAEQLGIHTVYDKKKYKINVTKKNNYKNFNIKFTLIKFVILFYLFLRRPFLITDPVLKIKDIIIIFIKSFGKIIFLKSAYIFFDDQNIVKKNSFSRRFLKVKEKDLIDKIFNILAPELMPISFVEKYNFFKKQSIYLSNHIKGLGTFHQLYADDIFKIFAAEVKKSKKKLVSFNHGGGMGGIKLINFYDYLDKKYANKVYKFNSAFISLPNLSAKNNLSQKKKDILIYPTQFMYQTNYRFFSREFHPYLNSYFKFYDSLESSKKKLVKYKSMAYPYSFSDKNIWSKILKKKQILNPEDLNSIYKARIVVINDISTPLYEFVMLSIPFIIISKIDCKIFNSSFRKQINNLEKLGLYYFDSVAAAKFINTNYDQIYKWWRITINKKHYINFKKKLVEENFSKKFNL